MELQFLLPVCVLLAWQERAGLKHKLLQPCWLTALQGYLLHMCLCLWIKGERRGVKAWGQGLWQQGGARWVTGRTCSLLSQPCSCHSVVLGFICGCCCDCVNSVVSNASVPVKEHTRQTIDGMAGQEGEQNWNSAGECCAGEMGLLSGDRTKGNLTVGSIRSDMPSLLTHKSKRCLGTFPRQGWSCRPSAVGNQLCVSPTRTSSSSSTFGVPFHGSTGDLPGAGMDISFLWCISGIYMEP